MDNYLGNYRILSIKGKGAQGTVSKAFDEKLERFVAIKKIEIQCFEREWLKKEAKNLAKLSHPHIVGIYELIEVNHQPYLVLEYADGPNLAETIKGGAFDFDLLIKVAFQLSAALAYSHKHGVLHRDVKPENIILTQANGVKLVDFGISELRGGADLMATIVPSAKGPEPFEGTLAYVAPEVIMGEPFDPQSEVFSLGCTLYEAMAGRRAFLANGNAATLNAVLNSHPPPIGFGAGAADWLIELVFDMLEKDPAKRIASMDDVNAIVFAKSGLKDVSFGGAPQALEARSRRQSSSSRRSRNWRSLVTTILTLCATGLVLNGAAPSSAPPLSVSDRMERGFNNLVDFTGVDAIEQAKLQYSSILSESPDHAGATAGLAIGLMREYTSRESDPATLRRATALADAALEKDPHLALAHIAAAWAAEFNGQYDEAMRHYQMAQTLNPDHILTIEGRARSLKKQSEFREAEDELRRGLEKYPENSTLLNELGDVMIRQGAYSEAESFFQRSITADPDNPFGYANAAQSLHMLGQTAEAVRVIQTGLEIVSDKSLYNNLGTYLYFEGRYEEAASAFERLLELDGNSHSYLFWANLGDAYRQIPGKQAHARRAYLRAIQIINSETIRQEEAVRIRSRLSLYAAKAGEEDLALANLERLSGKLSGRPAELYRAAMAWEILGRRPEALDALRQSIELGYPLSEIENEPEFAVLRQDVEYQLHLIKGEL